jgi:hypothetical protein
LSSSRNKSTTWSLRLMMPRLTLKNCSSNRYLPLHPST